MKRKNTFICQKKTCSEKWEAKKFKANVNGGNSHVSRENNTRSLKRNLLEELANV